MSRGLNKVMIIGNLGRDPEMRYTPAGHPVTTFTVACSRMWSTPDGERREETEWFNVVAWGNLAEICKAHLSKNQQVYVEGRLQQDSWEDKNDGTKKSKLKVVAQHVQFLDRAKNQDATESDGTKWAKEAPSKGVKSEEDLDSEIPF